MHGPYLKRSQTSMYNLYREVTKLTQLHVVTSEVQRLIFTGSLRMHSTACAQLHAAESSTLTGQCDGCLLWLVG